MVAALFVAPDAVVLDAVFLLLPLLLLASSRSRPTLRTTASRRSRATLTTTFNEEQVDPNRYEIKEEQGHPKDLDPDKEHEAGEV